MKKLILLLPAALLLSSCITRIFTVSPAPKPVTVVTSTPTTVVTTPTYTTVHTPAKPATTINVVAPYCNADYLDLQAVAAAFAQSNTVQEFEFLLNNSSIMLSNLDLNGDGYIDYLRVLETVSGYNHVFLIQAVLAYNVYQDVATIIADVPAYGTCYVQVIGAPYIYGPKYIIQPVFARTPLIYTCLRAYGYRPWRSPYYWNHYPSPYTHPAPMPYSHYSACVTTYMSNHHYCNNVTVVNEYHINNYTTIIQNDSRSDYARQNPGGAATTTYKGNTTTSTGANSGSRGNTAASTQTSTTVNANTNTGSRRNDNTTASTSTAATPSKTTTTTTGATSSRTNTATTTTGATSSRGTSATTTTSTSSRTAATTPGTTVSTRISSTGKTTTTTTTRAENGTTTKTVTSSRTTAPTRTSVSTSTTPARTTSTSSRGTSTTTTTSGSSRR